MIELENDSHIIEQDGDILVPDISDGVWADNGPFDHAFAGQGVDLAVDGYPPSVDSGEIIDELSKRKKRQEQLLKQHGFLATSPGELVRATGLTRPDMQSPGGAAKYIAIIVQRQNNLEPKPDDPAAAGRAVTGEMIEFAKKARGDRAGLKLVGDILDGSNLLPTTPIAEVSGLEGWQHDGLLRRAFLDLQRLTESLEFVEGKGADHLGDVYSSADKDMVKKLQKFVDSLSIMEAKDLIRKCDEQHKTQLKFWVDRLNEIEKRSMDVRIKAMTRQALINLGVTRPE